ncbi:MAG: YitT family protein, partial [Acutalibacteraceae bacterium]|nr:YitT family protein [Acutalibacteraceae bacterium]
MKGKKIKPIIIDIVGYLIGAFIYSAAVTMFISPNEISPGGVTGVSTAVNYLFGLPTGMVLLIINIPIIIIG